jgi:hypothetical protein
MKRIVLAALAAFIVCAAPVHAATGVAYQGNANQLIPVASSTPLPVNILGGSINASFSAFVSQAGVATAAVTDTAGRLFVNVATGSLNTTSSFATSAGVATSAYVDSSNRAIVNAATGTVAISNGLAVEQGLTYGSYAAVATNALTLLSDFASGTAVPFWISIQNIGSVNIYKQVPGTAVSDNALYLPIGDTLTWYVATNTPALGFHAPTTGAVGALAVEITK